MDFLYFLEDFRFPVLNEFMLLITQLGEETTFLVVALVFFWCFNKKYGYYLMAVGFVGTLANQFMKLLFRIPRPWVIDSSFTILEQAREAASGYSFPSGHTQSAVGTFGVIATVTKRQWMKVCAVIVAILVPFSRMYIGVHTPLDVIVAAVMAVALIFLMRPIVLNGKRRTMITAFCVMLAMAIGFLLFVECYPFPTDVDAHNLASGLKNAYTLLGALVGLLVVYIVDERWLHFKTEAVWWAQLAKIILGLLIVLLIKSGLKTPLNALLGEAVGRAVRYFLIVISAGLVWPLSFGWFAGLGKRGEGN